LRIHIISTMHRSLLPLFVLIWTTSHAQNPIAIPPLIEADTFQLDV
jgi:hypothetical protein